MQEATNNALMVSLDIRSFQGDAADTGELSSQQDPQEFRNPAAAA
jgi:hypothetical protein